MFAVEAADEASRFLVEGTFKADLIFADIHLPGPLNGIDLASLANKQWPDLPIILSSGCRGQQALETGCTPVFVAKPWHSLYIGGVCRRTLAAGARLGGDKSGGIRP